MFDSVKKSRNNLPNYRIPVKSREYCKIINSSLDLSKNNWKTVRKIKNKCYLINKKCTMDSRQRISFVTNYIPGNNQNNFSSRNISDQISGRNSEI